MNAESRNDLLQELEQIKAQLRESGDSTREGAEIELPESELLYQIMLRTSIAGFCMMDGQGNFLDVNEAYCRKLGYERGELLQLDLCSVDASEDKHDIRQHLETAAREGADHFQTSQVSRDGSLIDFEISTTLLKPGGDRLVAFLRNITWRREAEEHLRQVNEELRRSNQELRSRNRQLHAAEQQLHASEQQLRAYNEELHREMDKLAEAQAVAHLGSWERDLSGDVISGSMEFFRLFGWNPEGPYSIRDFYERVHPADRERLQQVLANSYEHNEPYEVEYRILLPDGTERHLAVRGRTGFNQDDRPTRTYGICLDTSERKLAESARAEVESRYRRLHESMMDCFIQTDMEGNIVEVNQSFLEMLGYSEEEVYRLSYRDLTPEKWHARETGIVEGQILPGGYSEVYEKEYICKDGSTIPVDLRTFLLLDEEGKPAGMWAIVRNISRRKQAEEALRESEARFRHTLDEMLEGCQIISPDWRYLYVNDTAAQHGRASRDELLGRTMMEVYPGIEQSPLFEVMQRCMRERSSERMENTFQFPDGSSREFELSVEAVPEGLFILSIDITARKRIEEELRLYREKLEQEVRERTRDLVDINQALDSFSYSVSHDLRTPLRAIDGFTHILLEDYGSQLDEEGLRICNVIRSSTLRMGRLIDDLLAFSRMERSEAKLEPVDMAVMARAVFKDLMSGQEAERIHFNLEELPPAMGDPAMLRQVWINLLSNALKFSAHRNPAEISISAVSRPGEVVYTVSDNGAGFDMRFVDKLFGVFQRLHTMDEFEGTGVGLALVKRIIEKHNGRVWAEGVLDGGAVFNFTLPERHEDGKP